MPATTPANALPYPVATDPVTDYPALAASMAGLLDKYVCPVGVILPYVAAAAPTGWLLCDGSVVSRTTYAALFAKVGTAFNTGGEAGTDFRLPDMRGRMPVGQAPGGGHADMATIGGNDGAALANRRPKHSHTVGGYGVQHASDRGGGSFGTNAGGASTSSHSHTVGPTSAAPVDAPAYLILQWIIRA